MELGCFSYGKRLQQLLRCMKITAALLLVTCLQVCANGKAQTISLSLKNAPLEEVFKEIKKQSGYRFVYTQASLEETKKITVEINNAGIEQALTLIFKDQPVTYSIQEKMIVLKKKEVQQGSYPFVTIPPVGIHGRITDSLGNPLSGASVSIKGRKGGITTDARGEFELKNVAENTVLIISYTGYVDKEYKLRDKDMINKLSIVLSRSNSPLDEVQVVAYGTNTRRFSVGAISTVTSEEIERQPVQNVLLALEGLVPGLSVTPSSGAPGAAVQLQIRGQNTLKGASPLPKGVAPPIPFDQPLFIIDGVPMATQNNSVNELGSLLNNPNPPYGGLSPFNGISPQDIESISILKDADATSIYGSQGANGVVLITTKKGRPGKTQVNISVNSGPSKVTKHTEMMNTTQYLAMRREAIQNDGLIADPNSPADYPDLFIFDTTRNHNWFNEFFGGTANNTDMHLQVSGGNNSTTFLLSGGYNHQVFNTPGNFANDGLFYHSGFHYNSMDHRLNVDVTADVSYTTSDNSGSPSTAAGFLLPPDLPALRDSKGNLAWTYKGLDIADYQQYGYTLQSYKARSYMFNNGATIDYRVLPGLNIRALVGYSDNRTGETRTNPLSAQDPTTGYSQNYAQFSNNSFQTVDVEPQIDYNLTRGKHTLAATFGGEYKAATNSTDQLEGYGYPTDALLNSVAGANYLYGNNSSEIYKYAAGFGRIRYIYNQKYILSITGRRDGSSKFGPGRQFGSFGSVGAGWIISEEPFFKKALPFISFTKLAGNYGTTGNDGVTPYQYLSLWQPIQNTPDFQGIVGYKPLNLYNPDYGWETKRSFNISLDLGFLHDRVLFNASYYLSRCGNQLTGALLPSQTGFSSVLQNFPADVQNTGLELTVTSRNIISKNFSWSSSFIISGNRNKLVSFPNLAKSPYVSFYTLGKPVTAVHGYKSAGLNDSTGLYQFYNGQGKIANLFSLSSLPIAQGGDNQVIGDLTPVYSGSLVNTLGYKGLSLSFTFQFSKGKGYTYLHSLYGNGVFPGAETNMPVILENRWRKPGDQAQIQQVSTGNAPRTNFAAGVFAESDGVIGDASYIRLKNVALSYSLPPDFLKKIGLKDFSLYLRGQNLLTITGYKVGDPEMQNLYTFPLQRTVVGGISINL